MEKDLSSLREKALEVNARLSRLYPDTRPLLDYRSPFELMAGVILSAQTTDNQVNKVTPELFRRFPDPARLGAADVDEVEEIVKTVGFFRMKARNLVAASAMLAGTFEGRMPDSIEELVRLPGVGRKSANVIVGHCYGKPAVIVDTHFMRVTGRIGLTDRREPREIEMQIRSYLPESIATEFSMVINLHGRRCCTARKPACGRCPVLGLCGYMEKTAGSPPV